MKMTLFPGLSSLLALSLAFAGVQAEHSIPPQARHFARRHELARRAEGDVQLHKRVSGSKWSYYDAETGNRGSCGQFITNGQYAVAMNVAQYQQSDCLKTITLEWQGTTAQAVIMDMCPGCPPGGLDLTPGLFTHFASHDKGIIWDGNWSFGGAPKPTPTPPPPPPPEPTPTPTPTPPPPPPPSSTWSPPPSSSSSSSHPPSSSASSRPVSSGSASSSSSAASTSSTSSAAPSINNLDRLHQLALEFADIAIAGAAAPRE